MLQTIAALAIVLVAGAWLVSRPFRRRPPAVPDGDAKACGASSDTPCSCSSCPVARR